MRILPATARVLLALTCLGLAPRVMAEEPEVGAAPPAAETPSLDGATDAVERLHGTLLAAMKDAERLGFEGRRELLAPVLDDTFDFPFMGRLALGFGWRKLEEEQQRRWVDTFRDFSLATYAGRFDGWSGQGFETLDTEFAAHDTVLVKTVLSLPDEDDVSLHYRLRHRGDGWRIIDIYMNGTVSEIALRRSEFSAVLDRDGFDALLAELESKIASYRRGEASSA